MPSRRRCATSATCARYRQHQGHHGVFAGQRFKPEFREAGFKAGGHRAQMHEQGHADRAVQDVDRFVGGGRLSRRDRIE